MIIKNPDTQTYNVGCYRLMIKDKKRMAVHLNEVHHAYHIYTSYEERFQPMDVAIVIGHHPAFLLGSCCQTPLGIDELKVCAGILGEPLEIVKCETVDLHVPAYSEIVIEGRIPPNIRVEEGPFGEITGLYSPVLKTPLIEVSAITMREDAIFHNLYTPSPDHFIWDGMGRMSRLYKLVKQVVPTVKEVYLPPSGAPFTCVIALKKMRETDPKDAILATFIGDHLVKYCIVIDEDVNIFDEGEVFHAVVTRLNPDEGLFSLKRCSGNPIDPIATQGYTIKGKIPYIVTKVGIDATKPLSGFPEDAKPKGVKVNV